MSEPLPKLRREWMFFILISISSILLFYWSLRELWSSANALRWLILSLPPLIYGSWVTLRALPENHRPGETMLLSTLGAGNWLTLLRGLLICMVGGFLFSPWPVGGLGWLPVLLYTTADVADYLDGYLARIRNHATLLGSRLDMEFDGLGMLLVTLLAVWYGQLPWWYLLLGLARYLFIAGQWLRERRDLPLYPLPHSAHRRLFAGFQMGFMSAVLWPIMPPAFATIAGTIFAIPTALGFLRDWLIVCGRLRPASDGYRRHQRQIVHLTRRLLPPLLRILLAILIGAILIQLPDYAPPSPWVALFRSWRMPAPAVFAWLSIVVFIAGGVATAAGWLPRWWSFWLVFPLGFDMVTRGLDLANGLGLAAAVSLMLLGSGPFSLWQPEERYLLQRAGGNGAES